MPAALRIGISVLGLAFAVYGEEAALQPVTVCEAFQDLSAHAGKAVVVVGRYSFRRNGRTLGETRCAPGQESGVVLDVVFDSKTAPKPAGALAVSAPALYKKLGQVKTQTQLAKIPFGSSDYDRWAFIYGRIEDSAAPAANGAAPPSKQPPARRARIVASGEALVVFIGDQ